MTKALFCLDMIGAVFWHDIPGGKQGLSRERKTPF